MQHQLLAFLLSTLGIVPMMADVADERVRMSRPAVQDVPPQGGFGPVRIERIRNQPKVC
jgi:hypothetical protein